MRVQAVRCFDCTGQRFNMFRHHPTLRIFIKTRISCFFALYGLKRLRVALPAKIGIVVMSWNIEKIDHIIKNYRGNIKE